MDEEKDLIDALLEIEKAIESQNVILRNIHTLLRARL